MLEVRRLSLSLGQNLILNDINIDIQISEKVGIIGASGSGKSIFALTLLQLLPFAKKKS
jgi:peptide/nickel transport system ATP-binding protein